MIPYGNLLSFLQNAKLRLVDDGRVGILFAVFCCELVIKVELTVHPDISQAMFDCRSMNSSNDSLRCYIPFFNVWLTKAGSGIADAKNSQPHKHDPNHRKTVDPHNVNSRVSQTADRRSEEHSLFQIVMAKA